MEQPKMQKLMPDSKGKAILDIGCGYGHNCLHFAENGAAHVTGIDISEKIAERSKKKLCTSCNYIYANGYGGAWHLKQ